MACVLATVASGVDAASTDDRLDFGGAYNPFGAHGGRVPSGSYISGLALDGTVFAGTVCNWYSPRGHASFKIESSPPVQRISAETG